MGSFVFPFSLLCIGFCERNLFFIGGSGDSWSGEKRQIKRLLYGLGQRKITLLQREGDSKRNIRPSFALHFVGWILLGVLCCAVICCDMSGG